MDIDKPNDHNDEKSKMMKIIDSVTNPKLQTKKNKRVIDSKQDQIIKKTKPSLGQKKQKIIDANWQSYLGSQSESKNGFRKEIKNENNINGYKRVLQPEKSEFGGITPIVGLDCEMVQCGDNHELARVSIVNYNGKVLMDEYVRPTKYITNYLTWVSGITRSKIQNAKELESHLPKITQILKNRKVVGHSLKNDFNAINLDQQICTIRDLTRLKFLQGDKATKGLKQMAKEHLNINIQQGQHSSVEDARVALAVYRKFESKIEHILKQIHTKKI